VLLIWQAPLLGGAALQRCGKPLIFKPALAAKADPEPPQTQTAQTQRPAPLFPLYKAIISYGIG